MWELLCVTLVSLLCVNGVYSQGKPSVDPGLFMIMGVKTCRGGSGYCLMGLDCTLDDDFLPDDTNGHCGGLKSAFTPTAHFTCCKYNTERDHVTTTKRPRPGLLKPTTTSTSTSPPSSTTAESTTITEALVTTTGLSETTTITQSEPVDVFIDVNNEVIKEILPPSLENEQQSNIISSELLEFLKNGEE